MLALGARRAEGIAMTRQTASAALLALLAGCSSPTTQGPTHGPDEPAAAVVGPDVEGRTVKLSDFAGKVVLLDFWKSN
jgi:hypothetical protein